MIKAKIKEFSYRPTFKLKNNIINFDKFDINKCPSSFVLKIDKHNSYGISKWVSPKRTRSEPFSRIYSTYHLIKKITIIPIIKDEGKNGDLDRINSLTLSWMNLTNVFIILAWYDKAEFKNKGKITNQKFNNNWIKKKIQEIKDYQFDAHHWNNKHFEQDFLKVFDYSINSYKNISKNLKVDLSKRKNDLNFINLFIDKDSNFNLKRFIKHGLENSKFASRREVRTKHNLEIISKKSIKEILLIENNLGGKYFLTVDEMFFNKNYLILRESKNSTNNFLPSLGEIKDALFKVMLFKNIDYIEHNNKKWKHLCEIILYGKNNLDITLPTKLENNEEFIKLNSKHRKLIYSLNKESCCNKIKILLRSNKILLDD